MFKIPEEYDTDILTIDQKDELCQAISDYAINYMSNNRLPNIIKDNIELDKYLDIRYNLMNSEQLVNKIKSDEIKLTSLPWLEPNELDNKLWLPFIDRRNKNRDIKEKMATVNIFKCRKCGEMKCTSYQLQTASIDEPMTTFISCKVCGNRWKV